MTPDNSGPSNSSAWLPRGLVLLVFTATAARVATIWDALPVRMASHFGASGQPNGFMNRDAFFITMALVDGGVAVLLLGMPVLLHYIPTQLINVPNRDYWLAPERRESSIERLGSWLAWFALAVAALFGLVLELTIRANLEQSSLDSAVFLPAMALFFATVIGMLIRLYRAFRVPNGSTGPRAVP